ncbi:MAG: hypothetical protein AAF550_11435, partial [Myxococcota bacterium]
PGAVPSVVYELLLLIVSVGLVICSLLCWSYGFIRSFRKRYELSSLEFGGSLLFCLVLPVTSGLFLYVKDKLHHASA